MKHWDNKSEDEKDRVKKEAARFIDSVMTGEVVMNVKPKYLVPSFSKIPVHYRYL